MQVLFCIWLERFRQSRGWTIDEISEKSGIPYRTYQNWERGYREPPTWLQPIIKKYLEGII